jgi:hypothetical protein
MKKFFGKLWLIDLFFGIAYVAFLMKQGLLLY